MRPLKTFLVPTLLLGLAAGVSPVNGQDKVEQLIERAGSARDKGDYHDAAETMKLAYEQAESDLDRHEIAVMAGFIYTGLEALEAHEGRDDAAAAAYRYASTWFARALDTAPGAREFLGVTTVWVLDFEAAQRLVAEFLEQHAGDERTELARRLQARWRSIRTDTELANVHGDELAFPVKIEAPRPVYTDLARRKGQQGSVELQLILDEAGNIANIFTEERLPYGLTEAAIGAILRWDFEPATVDGNPIPMRYSMTISFSID